MPGKEDFQCLICHDVVSDCRSTSCCGALTCGSCVEGQTMKSCPQCRSVTFSFRANQPMQRLANELDITCDDCSLIYKHSDKHDGWCPAKEVQCFFVYLGCEWKGPRKSHEEHLAGNHTLKCPNGHDLSKEVTSNPAEHWICSVCQQRIVQGGIAFVCRRCDYSECPGCFCNRPVRHFAPNCNVGKDVESSDDSDCETSS